MYPAPLMGSWLIIMVLAFAHSAKADEPDAADGHEVAEGAVDDGDTELEDSHLGGVGDNNRMHFRSPINVLTNVHVEVHVSIGTQAPDAGKPKTGFSRRGARADQSAPSLRKTRRQARRKIRLLDDDGDGQLNLEELKQKLPATRATRFIKRLDTDEDEFLTEQGLIASQPALDESHVQ